MHSRLQSVPDPCSSNACKPIAPPKNSLGRGSDTRWSVPPRAASLHGAPACELHCLQKFPSCDPEYILFLLENMMKWFISTSVQGLALTR